MQRITLADLLIGQARRQPDASAALTWLAAELDAAVRRTLTPADLARLDSYHGGAEDLHALLPSVLPLARTRWYEATVTAQYGTEMTMGYLAVPAGDDAIDLGWCCYVPAHQRILGPLGPVRASAPALTRPPEMTDALWREARSTAGITIRALLVGL